MTQESCCVNCSAGGIEAPGQIKAVWYDEAGKTDGKRHLVCHACLYAGNPDGPGYRLGAHQLDLKRAIDEAQGRWIGADWKHEFRRDGAIVRSDDGETPVYCNGELADCELCAAAKLASFDAHARSHEARRAIARGDFATAAELLSAARDLEAAYGDAPAWGPVAELAERLRDEQGGER